MPAALLLLAAALALLLFGDGGVVQAQGSLYVTNIGEAIHSTSDLQFEDLAQEFTTGSNDAGYTLVHISLVLTVTAVGNLPPVKLFHTSATGIPVATLTTPTSVIAGPRGVYSYTAPAGTTLAKETSYWIVVEGGRPGTADNANAGEGHSEVGWSIADQQERRAQSSPGAFTTYTDLALKFDVNGTLFTNTAASGAPAITPPNVFHVPSVLRVDLSGISDPDGTTNMKNSATYKWQRFDATGATLETDSIGTGWTYTLTDADVGKRLKVVVNFTDDTNNSEGPLTSAATPVITANTAPTSSDYRVTMEEDTTGVFGASNFPYYDTDGDVRASVKITTLPAAGKGVLKLDGTAITDTELPRTVTYDELAERKLRYTPPANAFGSPYTTFKFKVNDGTADSALDYTMSINITGVDDPGRVSIRSSSLFWEVGVTLTASVNDPDGNVTNASWRWMRGDTATGTYSNISGATATTYDPVEADVGKYLKARVSYTDGHGSGKSATSNPVGPMVVIEVVRNAEPAFSSTTATRTLPENSLSRVNVGPPVTATDSDDGDFQIYGLKNTGDHASFTIVEWSGQIQAKTRITYDFETKSSYTVTVTVHDLKDAAGDESTVVDDEIEVTINLTDVNEAPTITGAPYFQSVPENSTAVITFSATDVDASDTLTWSVESLDDGGKFTIDPSSGALRFISAPDFSTPTDTGDTAMNNTYVVTVKATDAGGLSATHTITVTVTTINKAPEITTVSATHTAFNVDENTATSVVIKTYEAADVSGGSVLTWTLEGADRADFTITKNAQGHGELRFANVPNYEMPADAGANNVYDVTVKVTDSDGSLPDTLMVRVTVDDVNETPVITSPPTTRSVPENSTAVATLSATDVDASDTLTWSVESADDGGKFEISSGGVLSFTNAPDFSTRTGIGDTAIDNTYVVTVKVTDAGGLSATHTITVTVTNINKAPEITTVSTTYTAFNVDENTATSVVIKTYEAADVGGGSVLTWTLEGDDRSDFTITKNTQGHGELKFARVPNYEGAADSDTDNVYEVTVKVTDNQGSLSDTLMVRVTVDDVNEAPVVSGNAAPTKPEIEFDVLEGDLSPMDYEIGAYTAYDDDANTVAWSVSGTDSTHFAIDRMTGVLTFSIRPDFENPVAASGNTYVVVVEANDGQGGVGTFNVTVTVTNVNETPEFTGNPCAICRCRRAGCERRVRGDGPGGLRRP